MGRMKEKFMELREQGVINTPYTNDMFNTDENLILRSFIEISLRDLDVIAKYNQPGEHEEISQQTLEYIESRKKQLENLLIKIEKLTR
jgi:hypothetical protein